MMHWPILSYEAAVDRLSRLNEKRNYYAMFNSLLGGIVTDPELMSIPIDDHMVHRGDGVFEALKCVHNRIYGLDAHLDRLERSAASISLKLPFTRSEIRRICCDTTRIGLDYARTDSAMLRLFVSRGPGSFTPSPYESIGSQLYLVIAPWKPVAPEKYDAGVKIVTSQLEVKSPLYAQIKSCNYLPNVLLKKEAVDKGADFAVSLDETGRFAEGPTENFAIVSESGVLIAPSFERTLRGITLQRVFQFSSLISELQGSRVDCLFVDDVMRAREAFMVGTTLDVLPVTTINGMPVNKTGEVGPVSKKLRELFLKDLRGEEIEGLESFATLV